MNRRRALQVVGLGGAVTAVSPRLSRAAELDEVKIGTPLTISDAPILIAEHKGYCRDQGIRTTVINLVTGSQMVAPLVTSSTRGCLWTSPPASRWMSSIHAQARRPAIDEFVPCRDVPASSTSATLLPFGERYWSCGFCSG